MESSDNIEERLKRCENILEQYKKVRQERSEYIAQELKIQRRFRYVFYGLLCVDLVSRFVGLFNEEPVTIRVVNHNI